MDIEDIEKNKIQNLYYQANPEMFDMLIAETFKNVTSYGKRFKSKALYNLRNWVESQLTFMSGFFDNYSPTQCTYMIFTGMTDFPKCPICGGPINDPKAFRNIYTGFAITCSRKCGETYRQHAYINTCMAKYGKPHYAMDKTRYEQSRDAMERKYGVRNVFQRTDVKKTIKQTLKTRYGNENYINFEKARETRLRRYGKWESDDSLQKRKRTYFKHYGVEHNMKSEVGIKEYEAAIQQKFGVKNVSQLDAIKKKKIETCKSHFGVDYPQQFAGVSEKTRQTCIKKYGYEYALQSPAVKRNGRLKYEYQGVMFDSKPELAFYIWLKDNGIEFEFHPNISFIYEYAGKRHVYQPDFKVGAQLIEIKGDQFFKLDGTMCNPYDHKYDAQVEAKHKCMISNNVKIIRTAEYKQYVQYILQKYGAKLFKDARCKQSGK